MKYLVLSRGAAQIYTYTPHKEKSIMISIYSPGGCPLRIHEADREICNILQVLPLEFSDSEFNEKGLYDKPISKEQAQLIVDFVRTYKYQIDQIIVHCDAGVSRSAGVCAAIAKALDNDDIQFFNSNYYCPNMTCYRRVLNAFMEG